MFFNYGTRSSLAVIASLVMLLLSGCSTIGSYEKIEEGRYLISVNSNAFSSTKKRKAKFEEKAAEACESDEWYFSKYLPGQISEIKTYDKYNTKATVYTSQRIVNCGKRVYYYDHPNHGTVDLPDERFDTDKQSCEKRKYENGIEVDGLLETDLSKIKSHERAFLFWSIKHMNTEQLKERDKHAPPQFSDLARARIVYKECMDSKGWRERKERAVISKPSAEDGKSNS